MSTVQKLKEAIRLYRETSTECFEDEAIQAFSALYGMLGEVELYDGICSAMQDEGYEETYEGIMSYYRELGEEA